MKAALIWSGYALILLLLKTAQVFVLCNRSPHNSQAGECHCDDNHSALLMGYADQLI